MSLFNLNDLQNPEGAMKSAWHMTILVAVFLTVAALVLFERPVTLKPLTGPRLLFDAALVLGLGYGVYRRSRLSATLLFSLWAINIICVGLCFHAAFSIFTVLVGVTYFSGMTGAFEYHQQLKRAKSRATQG
jgi:hypothetical protein